MLADLKPSGKYVMADLVNIGGTVPLMKMLLDAGLLHGDCMTVTGRTMRENLEKLAKPYPEGQDIIRPLDNPIKKDSHLRILYGNLAEGGAVAKISGKEGEVFTGKARVFDSEDEGMKAILGKQIKKGDVIVIRMEGPKGGPGMREMLGPTSAVMGLGLGKDVALITDGRFSGGSHGFVVGHITPEAYLGGTIAILEDGDEITIDAAQQPHRREAHRRGNRRPQGELDPALAALHPRRAREIRQARLHRQRRRGDGQVPCDAAAPGSMNPLAARRRIYQLAIRHGNKPIFRAGFFFSRISGRRCGSGFGCCRQSTCSYQAMGARHLGHHVYRRRLHVGCGRRDGGDGRHGRDVHIAARHAARLAGGFGYPACRHLRRPGIPLHLPGSQIVEICERHRHPDPIRSERGPGGRAQPAAFVLEVRRNPDRS